ncbi:MAG: SGNH/GDSL hydrolase family protein [Ruminococcus sp.]
MKNKFLALISSACMLINTLLIYSMPVSAEENSDDVKIMSLGDSITDGYWTAGGYRKYLYHELELKGYNNIDMVGMKGSDNASFVYNGETVSYDDNYSGYSGYAIQYMTGTETRQGILETIQETDMINVCKPDIILLQIGTNDILSNYNDGITERLENLVNTILSDMEENDIIYVSTIPDIDVEKVSDWFWSYGELKYNNTTEDFTKIIQDYIDSYNESIYNMVNAMQSEGKPVKFADIHSVVDYKADLYDGVHPNEQGYEKMGKYWSEIIESELSGEISPVTETTTATEPIIPEKNYSISDAVRLSEYLLCKYEITPEDDFDINSDGAINIFDLVTLKAMLRNRFT